jgi:hypothetical protein
MTIKEITIAERITRGQMMDEMNTTGNVVAAAWKVTKRLRERGIPAIGSLGLIAVEWGTLTIEFERGDGYDVQEDDFNLGHFSDAWVYTWTGRPVPAGVDLTKISREGKALVMDMPLNAVLAEADDL